MNILARLGLCIGGIALLCGTGFAQIAPAPIAVRPAPRTATRTVAAIVATVNAPMRTVSLLIPADGVTPTQTVFAAIDPDCKPLKNSAPAPITTFAAGEWVVARLTWRLSPPAIILRDLYDAASYTERQRQGKEICAGVVETFSASEIAVRCTDGMLIAFRVTDKTILVKSDAPATLAAFPVGASVAVKPRRLPGGSLMAAVVGGTPQETLWAYRDALTTWSGTVTGVQGDAQSGAVVSLRRDDGATRQFLLPAGTPYLQRRTRLPWQQLTGANISAHLVKGATQNTMRTADAVKAASRRATKPVTEPVEEP